MLDGEGSPGLGAEGEALLSASFAGFQVFAADAEVLRRLDREEAWEHFTAGIERSAPLERVDRPTPARMDTLPPSASG